MTSRHDWTRRATDPEWMDDAALPVERLAAVLRDLAQVNGLTRAAAPTLAWLAGATRPGDRFSLLDVGCGHGDMLRRIARWARRTGRHATLTGVDQNPNAIPVARAATPAALAVRYHVVDAEPVVDAMPAPPDFLISSLVAHHMTDAALVAFLRWMDATARRGWFVNDLHRHPVACHGFRLLAAAMRWDPIVRHDGALSVRRAFTRADWAGLLHAAGLEAGAASVRWHLPFRLCVGRLR